VAVRKSRILNASTRTLVVGCTGMIGRHIVNELLLRGCQVHGVARFREARVQAILTDRGVITHSFDVARDNPAKLPDADVVFFACRDASRPDLAWAIGFTGLARLVERYAGRALLVNGASGEVYAQGDLPPQRETDLPEPKGAEALACFTREAFLSHVCAERRTPAIHLRYFHANDETHGLVPGMARAIAAGRSLGGTPEARVQVIAIEDLVRCTIEGVNEAAVPAKVVNICHPRVWTMRELAETVHRVLGRGRVVFDTESGGAEASRTGDASEMERLFGPPRVPLQVVVERAARAVPRD